jgi:hypothetical protein
MNDFIPTFFSNSTETHPEFCIEISEFNILPTLIRLFSLNQNRLSDDLTFREGLIQALINKAKTGTQIEKLNLLANFRDFLFLEIKETSFINCMKQLVSFSYYLPQLVQQKIDNSFDKIYQLLLIVIQNQNYPEIQPIIIGFTLSSIGTLVKYIPLNFKDFEIFTKILNISILFFYQNSISADQGLIMYQNSFLNFIFFFSHWNELAQNHIESLFYLLQLSQNFDLDSANFPFDLLAQTLIDEIKLVSQTLFVNQQILISNSEAAT